MFRAGCPFVFGAGCSSVFGVGCPTVFGTGPSKQSRVVVSNLGAHN